MITRFARSNQSNFILLITPWYNLFDNSESSLQQRICRLQFTKKSGLRFSSLYFYLSFHVAAFVCAQYTTPHLLERKSHSIISIFAQTARIWLSKKRSLVIVPPVMIINAFVINLATCYQMLIFLFKTKVDTQIHAQKYKILVFIAKNCQSVCVRKLYIGRNHKI